MNPAHVPVAAAARRAVVQSPRAAAHPVVHAADVALDPRQSRRYQRTPGGEPSALPAIHLPPTRDRSFRAGPQAADSAARKFAG